MGRFWSSMMAQTYSTSRFCSRSIFSSSIPGVTPITIIRYCVTSGSFIQRSAFSRCRRLSTGTNLALSPRNPTMSMVPTPFALELHGPRYTDSVRESVETLRFPTGFRWGTATSAHQVEGDNVHNDWWAWAQEAGRVLNGDRSGRACRWGARAEEDFDTG